MADGQTKVADLPLSICAVLLAQACNIGLQAVARTDVPALTYPTDQASLRTVQGRYSYYLHGPLKRLEIGDDLQGIDYSYTAQGWLKNVNHPLTPRDPGLDGTANNRLPDLFSQSLEYYGATDYSSARTPSGVIDASAIPARYDGNIRAATWNIQGNPLRGQAFDYSVQNQLRQAAILLVSGACRSAGHGAKRRQWPPVPNQVRAALPGPTTGNSRRG